MEENKTNVPNWMNNEFFAMALRNHQKSNKILIKNVQLFPTSAQEDHYGSVMFKGIVTYESQDLKICTKSIIIKTTPEFDCPKGDLLEESFLFETEIFMYSELIPKIERELRKIGDQTVLGVEVLYTSLEPKKVIIFEDICPKGFVNLRERQCNIEETKAAFLKLAKWHAVSYKLACEGDNSVKKCTKNIFSIKGFDEMPITTTGIPNFIEKLEQLGNFEEYLPKLRAIENNIIKRCIDSHNLAQQIGSKGIFVLCHGDFHQKNLMFKYNSSGRVDDVMLLDFQMCNYGPAILDVLKGIYMLADESVRTVCYDEMIYFYSSNFIETLKRLKFQGEIPKISDFFIEILRHRHWELFTLSGFFPMFAYPNCGASVEDIFESNEARKKVYDNPEFIKEVKKILPRMLHRGFLE